MTYSQRDKAIEFVDWINSTDCEYIFDEWSLSWDHKFKSISISTEELFDIFEKGYYE